MRFAVLGPLLVERSDGSPVSITSRRQQAVLAVLLIAGGRTVSTDRLIDAVWAEDLPANPTSTLQNSITHLRKALEPERARSAPPTVLLSSDGGYRLDLDGHRLDSAAFEQGLESAKQLHANGETERALTEVTDALDLWRGPAYAEFPSEPFTVGERHRLDELRMNGIELRIDCLDRGRGPETVVPELESLITDHPYREGLWIRLVTALYQAGRQADALQAYRRATETLADELGIEPSPGLRALEQKVLAQDPDLSRHRDAMIADNLPAPTSGLIGRSGELLLVADLVTDTRLVTLLGPGGSGKTRLAIEVACHLRDGHREQQGERGGRYRDGIWLIRLEDLDDPELLEPSVGSVLRMPESSELSVRDALVAHLRDRRLLLVLDNCEHLGSSVSAMVADIVARCPEVTVLATSQAPLNLSGEQRVNVPPLAVPGDSGGVFTALEAAPAMQLFIERAKAINPDQTHDEADIQAMANIVKTLDGLPLAIELAAARTVSLSPGEIARLLSDRFLLLTGGPGDLPRRQQALRATVGWSYNLLDQPEQAFFAALGVFVGGFDLDAAALVTERSEAETINLLDRLVTMSMVQRHRDKDGSSRYRLLETLRHFALQQLEDDGLANGLRHQHLRVFAERAKTWNEQLEGPNQIRAQLNLATDEDNFRAAMPTALSDGEQDRELLDLGLQTVTSLCRFWDWQGSLAEATTWLSRFGDVVDLQGRQPTNRGLLVWWQAYFLDELDRTEPAKKMIDLAVELVAAEPDRRVYAEVLAGKSLHLRLDGHPAEALAVNAEARAIAEEVDHRWLVALIDNLDALSHLALGDQRGAMAAVERSMAGFLSVGDRRATGWGLTVQAQVMLAADRHEEARDMAIAAMEISTEAGDGRNAAWASQVAATASRRVGDDDAAGDLERQAEALLTARGMPRAPWRNVEGG